MAKEGKVKEYEIWRGKRAKQPDGTEVFIKPSDGDFGSYGWAVSRVAVERILKALKDKFPDFPYDEFKACML